MIKRVIIILICLTLSAHAVPINPLIGLIFGMGIHNMAGVKTDVTNVNSKWGGVFGIYAAQSLGGFFWLQTALILTWMRWAKIHHYTLLTSMDGGMSSTANNALEMTEDISLGYIQIPVLMRYDIPVKGKFTPRVLLGPSFAFNISGKDKASGFGDYDGEYDIRNLKTLDIGGMMGVGVSFPVGKLKFGFDIIYERSFSSAFKDVTAEELANDVNEELWTKTDPVTFERTTEAVDFKNNGFSFQFNMVLPIGAGK